MPPPTTYSGATLGIADAVPETLDRAGFRKLQYKTGRCAMREMPEIVRSWDAVTNDVVCQTTSYDIKGGAKWNTPTFKLNRFNDDEAQAIYTKMEDDPRGLASFELILPNGFGIFYFVAQVSKFALIDGGGKLSLIHISEPTRPY